MSNNKNSNNSSTGGVGFLGLLALIFITLKLTGVIGWSWWWVLSPLWIPASIALLIFTVMLIGIVAVAIGKVNRTRWPRVRISTRSQSCTGLSVASWKATNGCARGSSK